MDTRKLVLLVEDDADDEELALLSLAQHGRGAEVVVVRDGVEALDFLFGKGAHADRDATDLPALILLDLKLPKLSGLDVLRHLREEAPARLVPVVVLSSSSEPGDIASSYRLGANSYVRKAIDFGEYAAAMRDIGRYWLNVNEPAPHAAH